MLTRLILAGALCATAATATAQVPATPATPATPAPAQPRSPLAEDVRCVLVMNAVTQQPQANAQVKEVAGRALVYYVGKVDGRGGADRLKMLLDREAKGMTAQMAQAEFARCGQAFQVRGGQLRAMSQAPPAPAAPKPAPKR